MRIIATYLIVQVFTTWNLWLSLTDARRDGTYLYLTFIALVFAHTIFTSTGVGIRQLFAVYLATTVVDTMLDYRWTGYDRVLEGVMVSASIGLAYLVPGLAGMLIRKLVYRRRKGCS
jgi:hypothetical protein